MKQGIEELRHYVQFLHEREGLREVRLTKAAQVGLGRLAAELKGRGGNPLPPVESVGREGTRVPTKINPVAKPEIPFSKPRAITPVKNVVAWAPEGPALVDELPVDAPPGSSRIEQLRHLSERAAVCVKCPHLAARRHTVVFGVGNPEAKLMFVGEGPGEEEDLKSEPFVGRAGQLLTKMIAAMGLKREDVYIANVVKCRPDMPPGVPGNRKPTKQEMETCVPYLRAQIDVIKPAALVALGATAVEGLLGPIGTIGSLRGKFLEYRGAALMPTYHPSYLLRSQGSNTEKRKVWEDLLKVMERLEMPISEKQRGFFLKG
jgi:DNA polymerase